MTFQSKTAFKVGLFTVLAVLLGVVGLIALGAGAFAKQKFYFETYVKESIHGLSVGSPVKLRGVQVGSVEEITFTGARYGNSPLSTSESGFDDYVVIVAALRPDRFPVPEGMDFESLLAKRIEEGLRIQLTLEGISGLLYLEANFFEDAPPGLELPWRPQVPYLPAKESAITRISSALNQLFDQVSDVDAGSLVGDAQRLITSLQRKADSLDMSQVQADVEDLIAVADSSLRDFRDLMAELKASGLVEDLSQTTKSAKRVLEQAEGELTRTLAGVRDLASNLNTRIDSAGSSADRSFQRVESLLASQSVELQELIQNLATATENLTRITETSLRYPSSLLFGEAPPRSNPRKP